MQTTASSNALVPAPLASAPASAIAAPDIIRPAVETLEELHAALSAIEAKENPDITVPLRDLRVTEEGTVLVPGFGPFVLTDWSRAQLESRLGIRWERWFALVSRAESAEEINTRLTRSRELVKLRTTKSQTGGSGEPGVLRAFVTQSYTPFADSVLAEMLMDVFAAAKYAVRRVTITARTVSYVLDVGGVFRPGGDAQVGDVRGGVIVRNSGVGYASLLVTSHLERLICTNGMVVPIEDPILLACVHRGVSAEKIRERLAERARAIGGAFAEGARRLLESRRHRVADRDAVFHELLRRAQLPKKLTLALEAAFAREPEETAFGIAQAATRAAQDLQPEARLALERAASNYVTALAPWS